MKILISNSLRKKSFSEVNWMFFLSRRGVEGSRKRCCRDAAGQTGFVDFNRRSNATTASRSDQQVAAVAERELWRGTLKFRKKLTSNIGRLAPIPSPQLSLPSESSSFYRTDNWFCPPCCNLEYCCGSPRRYHANTLP